MHTPLCWRCCSLCIGRLHPLLANDLDVNLLGLWLWGLRNLRDGDLQHALIQDCLNPILIHIGRQRKGVAEAAIAAALQAVNVAAHSAAGIPLALARQLATATQARGAGAGHQQGGQAGGRVLQRVQLEASGRACATGTAGAVRWGMVVMAVCGLIPS